MNYFYHKILMSGLQHIIYSDPQCADAVSEKCSMLLYTTITGRPVIFTMVII